MQRGDLSLVTKGGYDVQTQHVSQNESASAFTLRGENNEIDFLFFYICSRVFGSTEIFNIRIAGRNIRELIRRLADVGTVFEVGLYAEGYRIPGYLPQYIESCKSLEVLCTIYDSVRKPLSFTLVEIPGKPTFCKLKLLANELPRSHRIFELCVEEDSHYYLHTGKLQLTQNRRLIGLPFVNTVAGTDVSRYDSELQIAIHCSTWPAQAFSMIQRQKRNEWPSQTSIENIVRQGCYVVVCEGQQDPLVFNLSFDLAVRELIQSFNQCQFNVLGLVLLLVNKTFDGEIRSKISLGVKHCLFWAIHEQPSNIWDELNFKKCFSIVTEKIIDALEQSWCQSFFVRNCDVFGGSIQDRRKAEAIRAECSNFSNSSWKYFFQLNEFTPFQYLGQNTEQSIETLCREDVSYQVDFSFFQELAHTARELRRIFYKMPSISKIVSVEKQILDHCGPNVNHDMLRIVLNSIDSVKASFLLRRIQETSVGNKDRLQHLETIKLFLATKFDFMAGHLKLATFYLSTRNPQACRYVLDRVRTSTSLISLSRCYTPECLILSPQSIARYGDVTRDTNLSMSDKMHRFVVYWVEFFSMDMPFLPKPLRYEFEFLTGGSLLLDPFVYYDFLEILCSVVLDRPAITQRRVLSFKDTVNLLEGSKLYHVYLNVLGYCFYLINEKQEARRILERSLVKQPRNNAAGRYISNLGI